MLVMTMVRMPPPEHVLILCRASTAHVPTSYCCLCPLLCVQARDRVINAFREDPHVTVFLISLKAGGMALNLTAASRIYLMDPWWVLSDTSGCDDGGFENR